MNLNPVIKVDIKNLVAADWNYKDIGSEEQMNKLIESIKYDNSIGVLAVRQLNNGKFEVIDGNHRLEAVKKLGWKTIYCEDFGRLSKAQAIILSRRRNHEWFDDDIMEFGRLLKEDVVGKIDESTLIEVLPDSKEDIQNILQFNMFNWEEPQLKQQDNDNKAHIIKIKVNKHLFDKWMSFRTLYPKVSEEQMLDDIIDVAIDQNESL